MNWYNLHDGTQYKPGTVLIEDVKLTDKVPLFIREGAMILTQNTDSVSSTKDLDNKFTIVAGFHFNKQRSNDTFSVYNAAGAHISIGNYNDETKLQLCMVEGCEYVFNLELEVTENTRTMKIDVSYGGGILLN